MAAEMWLRVWFLKFIAMWTKTTTSSNARLDWKAQSFEKKLFLGFSLQIESFWKAYEENFSFKNIFKVIEKLFTTKRNHQLFLICHCKQIHEKWKTHCQNFNCELWNFFELLTNWICILFDSTNFVWNKLKSHFYHHLKETFLNIIAISKQVFGKTLTKHNI